ncbi:hypothetical protein GMSM_30970 [Geomonas sp. Red276]
MPLPVNPISVFDTSFLNYPHLKLASQIMAIGEAFMAHKYYQAMPPGVPVGVEIRDIGTRYHDLTYAVMTGTFGRKSERDALREKAVLATTLALNWAGMKYLMENDFDYISNLAVDHKKAPAPRSTTPVMLPAPNKVYLEQAPMTGSLRLVIGRVKGAAAYHIQACKGDPNDEAAWNLEWQFTKIKGGVTLNGLEPGKVYYVRVRCLGHAGLGPWSTYVHLMVT